MTALQLNRDYRIEEIVAHAPPMSLLEELVSYDAERIVVALTIRETSEFYIPDVGVPSWFGVEYMAQAIGAFYGIEDVQAGLKPQIGMLLGSRKYVCDITEFALGARLQVSAQLLLRDEENLVAFDCTIHIDGKAVARADLKAIKPRDVHALVKAQSYSSQ